MSLCSARADLGEANQENAVRNASQADPLPPSRSVWRIMRDGAGEAAWNMALDEALLEAVAACASPPTVRLYRWRHPAVTVGRFQNVARTVDLEACNRERLPLIRRLTGGRGILHGTDLTISIACAVSDLAIGKAMPATLDIYQHMARWFVAALSAAGIDAQLGDCERVRGQESIGNCFDIVSRADIVDARTGVKLIGSALHRRGAVLLQQTSIPLGAQPRFDGVFRGDKATGVYALEEGAAVQQELLIQGLLEAIRISSSGIHIVGGPTEHEHRAAGELVRERYAQHHWNLEGSYAQARN
jgi:lipoate-protein ligase A